MSKKAFAFNKLIHETHHYQNSCRFLTEQNKHLKHEVERLQNEIRILKNTCTIYPHNRDFTMDPSNCIVMKTDVQDVTNEFVPSTIPLLEPVLDGSRCFTYPPDWALYNNYLNPYHNPYGYLYNGYPHYGNPPYGVLYGVPYYDL